MLISFGSSLANSYVWLEATEKELKEARLRYRRGGEWKEIVDPQYPFEFSLPLADGEAGFDFQIEGVKTNGSRERSATVALKQ